MRPLVARSIAFVRLAQSTRLEHARDDTTGLLLIGLQAFMRNSQLALCFHQCRFNRQDFRIIRQRTLKVKAQTREFPGHDLPAHFPRASSVRSAS
jgi:hypothetical protein